jgi:hypothetical protein
MSVVISLWNLTFSTTKSSHSLMRKLNLRIVTMGSVCPYYLTTGGSRHSTGGSLKLWTWIHTYIHKHRYTYTSVHTHRNRCKKKIFEFPYIYSWAEKMPVQLQVEAESAWRAHKATWEGSEPHFWEADACSFAICVDQGEAH